MTVKQGWPPATVLQIFSIGSGLLIFAVGVFIAMGKDRGDDYRDHDRRITAIETSIRERREFRDQEMRQVTQRLDRLERH